jgi:citrate synthase
VGLTTVGSVVGYVFSEQDKTAVPGRLLYRGIDVPDLVQGYQKERRPGFEEVCYLLLFGELPTASELKKFCSVLDDVRAIPEKFKNDEFMRSPSPDVMNKLARCVLASYSYDPNPDDISKENVLRQCLELIASFPAFLAYGYLSKEYHFNRKPMFFNEPARGKSTAENFLMLLRQDMKYTKLEADVLDLCLILHAEHGGGNNSTFTNHVVTSTHTDTYSAMAASLVSLKGPLHGGANVQVERMMKDICTNVKNWENEGQVADYLNKILDRKAFDRKGLIYGLGHAVYTISDPRTTILREKAKELAKVAEKTQLFNLYRMVERLAPGLFMKYKKAKQTLPVNVDFYSGMVYNLLNIPQELYTPLFAMSRISGLSAHRIEELLCGGKIIRPAYKSIAEQRKFVPLKRR